VVVARLALVPGKVHAAVERGRLRSELFHAGALGSVAENEDVLVDLGIDARAGLEQAQRVLLGPQVTDVSDHERRARDLQCVAQFRPAVARGESLEPYSIRNVLDLARPELPRFRRDAEQALRRNDHALDSGQEPAPREDTALLEL